MCLHAGLVVVSGGVIGVVVGDDHHSTKFLRLVLKIFDDRATMNLSSCSRERSINTPTSTSGLTPKSLQMMRQLIAPPVQLTVAELLLFEDHRYGIGRALHLLLKQLV
jgi:hypothetical protein